MKVNDAISGAIFILAAALIFYLTRGFSVLPGQQYGAAFFPRTIAVVMALLGAALVVKGVRERGIVPWAVPFDWMSSPVLIANFALVVAALVFYILVSDGLGFAITAFVTLYVLLLWLRGGKFWLSSAVISLVSMVVMQQFFGQLLRVPLPWGVLQAYAW